MKKRDGQGQAECWPSLLLLSKCSVNQSMMRFTVPVSDHCPTLLLCDFDQAPYTFLKTYFVVTTGSVGQTKLQSLAPVNAPL